MTATAPPALQVSHASGLHSVNRVLAEMHREMLRVGGLESGTVRLCVLNLVAACVDQESAELAASAVAHLGAKHPARAIIVIAEAAAGDQIEADLSLQCSPGDSGQVCAEQVRLRVGGEAALHLASVVTPMLVPDIPVYLWLVGAPPLEQAFGQDTLAVCERLIVDSGAYPDHAGTLRELADQVESVDDAVPVADLAWERTHLWRMLIAQSFDGDGVRGFVRAITRVEIACGGERISAQGWLIAGWLASRLSWPDDDGAPEVVVTAQPAADVADHDLVRVRLHCHRDGREANVTVEHRGDAVHAVIDVDGGITVERTVPVSELDTIDLVAALLESDGDDPVYRPALRRAAGLAARPR